MIGLAMLAGAVLRFWSLPSLGLDHFDEGIYAIAGLWSVNPKGLAAYDAGSIAYAPPGFPILVGLSYLLLGVRDTAVVLVSIVAGVATIPVVAWLAKRSFGAGAGAAAAWLCALSGPHVAFSRTGLTDALALLTFLLALGFGSRFLERPGFWRAMVFGLAVGVAQNVKYSGFLSGVIVALAWLFGLFHVKHRARGPLLRTLFFGVLAAIVAALCYLPWFLFVEKATGYAGLLAHQRSYTSGISAWPAHWYQQLAQSVALSGLVSGRITWAGPAWAVAILSGAACAGLISRAAWLRVLIATTAAFALAGLMPMLAWWTSLAVVLGLWRHWARATHATQLCSMAWLFMSLLTPFYYPYARLWLPVEALGWVLVAGAIPRFVAELCRVPRGLRAGITWLGERPIAAFKVIAVVLICGIQSFGIAPSPVVWPWLLGPTDGLREATRTLSVGILKRDPKAQPSLMALPPAFFYFRVHGLRVRRVDKLDALLESKDWQIADELQARILSGLDAFHSAFAATPAVRYSLSGTTLLDMDPKAAFGSSQMGQSHYEWLVPYALKVRPEAEIHYIMGPAAFQRSGPWPKGTS